MSIVSFKKALWISALIHAFAVASFFTYTPTHRPDAISDGDSGRVREDSSLAERMEFDPGSFDSLLASLSENIRTDSFLYADTASLYKDLSAGDTSGDLRRKLLQRYLSDRYNSLATMLEHYGGSRHQDSLYGLSELLRRSVLNRAFDLLKDSMPMDLSMEEWNRIIQNLAARIRNAHSSQDPLRDGNAHYMNTLLRDAALMNLWERSLAFSLRETALQRLREIMLNALMQAAQACVAQGSDVPGGKDGSSKRGDGINGLQGNGSADFLGEFSSALGAMAGGYSHLPALFDGNGLFGMLGAEAYHAARQLLEAIPDQSRRLDSNKLSDILATAFASNRSGAASAERITAFIEALNKGFGDDMAAYLYSHIEKEAFFPDPFWIERHAREYLDLLARMSARPNLLVPNLAAYGETARKIRDRSLPRIASMLPGNAAASSSEQEAFISPQRVYIPLSTTTQPRSRQPAPLKPAAFFSNAWGGAPRAVKPITIDGNLNEWDICAAYALKGSARGLADVPDALRQSNMFFVQWDNRGLYFAYRLFDERDNAGIVETFWDADALELFFDPHNVKDSLRIEGRSSQFWIWPRIAGGTPATGQSIFVNPYEFRPVPLKEGAISHASVRMGDDYTVEVFVPFTLLKQWYPLPGSIIGFNYSINNGEGVLIRWVTNKGRHEPSHPNLWGDLVLMGSDAVMHCTPADFILPGQTVRISITDHDMNLRSDRTDQLWIKVQSQLCQDRLPIRLIETGENTGMFQAGVGTTFGLRPKEKQRLSTRPGDRITVYYLDQYGTGGRRNTALIKSIQVARGVFTLGKYTF